MSVRTSLICVLLKLAVASADLATPKPVGFLMPAAPKAKELSSQDVLETIVAALDRNNGSIENKGSLWDLQSIEESLGPIIAASPKNEHGRLGDSAARYALHRLFMERHGVLLWLAYQWWTGGSADTILQARLLEG